MPQFPQRWVETFWHPSLASCIGGQARCRINCYAKHKEISLCALGCNCFLCLVAPLPSDLNIARVETSCFVTWSSETVTQFVPGKLPKADTNANLYYCFSTRAELLASILGSYIHEFAHWRKTKHTETQYVSLGLSWLILDIPGSCFRFWFAMLWNAPKFLRIILQEYI